MLQSEPQVLSTNVKNLRLKFLTWFLTCAWEVPAGWLSELSELSDTIGVLSEYYRSTIGVLSDLHYRSYRSGDMLMHYRTLSELSKLSESIKLCYRNYRTSAHVRQLLMRKTRESGSEIRCRGSSCAKEML